MSEQDMVTPIVPPDPAREVVTTQGYLDNVAAGLLAWKERAEHAEQALLTLSKLHAQDHTALEHAERARVEAEEEVTRLRDVEGLAWQTKVHDLTARLADAERALGERADQKEHEQNVRRNLISEADRLIVALAAAERRGEEVREALAAAAAPLEILKATECDDAAIALNPALKRMIVTAVDACRAALVPPGASA